MGLSRDDRRDLKSLGHEELSAAVEALGQPAYRAGQLLRWMHGRGAVSFDEMTDLPSELRVRLAEEYRLGCAAIERSEVSRLDGTRKYLVRLDDGARVETVGLPSDGRLTVCFSTQAGCAMGCRFCATGGGGFVRDLSAGEMVDQVRLAAGDFGLRAGNAVAMGQGEPFANYEASLAALRIMNAKGALGIGARRLTVSTCGLAAGILRFAAEPEQFTLAVSLHSAVQRTRDELMPGLRGVTLPRLREALGSYAATGRRPTLEYALIEGVNDSEAEFAALTAFCRGLLCHVNLIPMNPVSDVRLRRASEERVTRFERGLAKVGVEASVRAERGADLQAACGQLRQRYTSPGR